MTENEMKAIKWMKNVRDDAVVTLDHIAKNEPNVSPMLYTGRKERAETILSVFDELGQYRALGTVEELAKMKEDYAEAISDWRQYKKIGTVEELREAMEKQRAKKQGNIDDSESHFKLSKSGFLCCSVTNKDIRYPLISLRDLDYCPRCGQHIAHRLE